MRLLQKCTVAIIIMVMAFNSAGNFTVYAVGKGTPEITENHVTGIKEPSATEKERFHAKAKTVKEVLPNSQGLERINNARKQKGLPDFPLSYAVTQNNEIISTKSSASKVKSFGLILSADEEINDSLPSTVDNSQSNHFPSIGDQGDIGSCASFATTYYAMTYETAAKRNIDLTVNPGRVLSPRFIYNLSNNGDDEGSSLFGNILTMYTHGVPFVDEASMNQYQYDGYDTNSSQYLEYPSSAGIWEDALKNKLFDFGAIENTDTSEGLSQIKRLINNGHVAIFGTDRMYDWLIDKSVGNDPNTMEDDAFAGQYACYGESVFYSGYSRHAMTIVGYNDNIWIDADKDNEVDTPEKGAFKVANSWGTKWGNNGFIWLSYEAFQDGMGYSNVITNNEVIYLVAQDEYTPLATAEISVTTARRDQLDLSAGVNWNDAEEPLDKVSAKDYVFNGHWGGPYSFEGKDTPSTASIILDISDYIKRYGFDSAGGALSFCAGVSDDTSDSYNQQIDSVRFKTGSTSFSTMDPMPITAGSKTDWFCARKTLTDHNPPAPANDYPSLDQMYLDTPVESMSKGAKDVKEWAFTPATSGIYRFSNGITEGNSGTEILNEAGKTIYDDASGNIRDKGVIAVPLYAGRNYVFRIWYEGVDGNGRIEAKVSMEGQWPASAFSSKITGITLSSGDTLEPAFNPDIFSYTVNVTQPNITIYAEPEDTQSYIVIDNKAGKEQTYDLPETGVLTARIDVTSQDWNQTRTYALKIIKGEPSSNANLAAIGNSAGDVSPSFDPNTLEYALTIAAGNEAVTLTPATADDGATFTIDGERTGSKEIKLNQGETRDAIILVKAEDNATARKYIIHVTRQVALDNAYLSNILPTKGTLSPAFEKETILYNITLSPTTQETTITPMTEDSKATFKINGEDRASKTVTLAPGENEDISVEVTAQDGSTTKTYSISVNRQSSEEKVVIKPYKFVPKEIVAPPDRPVLYMTGEGQKNVYEVNFATGAIRQISFPYVVGHVTYSNGKVYVVLINPEKSKDAFAIIESDGFTSLGTFPTGMDLRNIDADSNYIYAQGYYEIDVLSGDIKEKLSSIKTSDEFYDMAFNPETNRLYATTSGATNSYQISNGTILLIQQNDSYAGADLNITPDGRHILLDTGEVLACSANKAVDLQYVTEMPDFDKECTNPKTGEIYTITEKSIQIYDQATFMPSKLIQQPNSLLDVFYSSDRLIYCTKSAQNEFILQPIWQRSLLGNLKINGDAFENFYPTTMQYDRGEVDHSIGAVTIDAKPLYATARVSGDTGQQTLETGENVFTVNVTDPGTDVTEKYTIIIDRKTDDAPAPPAIDPKVSLGFTPLDMQMDPDRPWVYMTASGGMKLYAVNYETGEIKEKTFSLKAERFTLKNGKIYLCLLRQEHAYWTGDFDTKGSIAVIDVNRWTIERVFDIAIDPYDIRADQQGRIYVGPGSNQWGDLKVYSTQNGSMLESEYGISYLNRIDITPGCDKIYAMDVGGTPELLQVFDIGDGKILSHYYADKWGAHALTNFIKVSPDGNYLFNGAGNVFYCHPQKKEESFAFTLNYTFADMCFNLKDDEFLTAGSKTINAFTYSTHTLKYAIPTQNEQLKIEYDGKQIITLEKTDGGVYHIGTYDTGTLLSGITIDTIPLQNFYPLEDIYTPLIVSHQSSINVSATPYLSNTEIIGDTGIIPLNVGMNKLTITATNGTSGKTHTYTLNVLRQETTNAYLSGLKCTAGTLTPEFDKSTTVYTLGLPSTVSDTTLTPVLEDATAAFLIDGNAAASKTVKLSTVGAAQDVVVSVTAKDGTTQKQYTIHVVRMTSNNANLSNLYVYYAAMSPQFDKDTLEYTAVMNTRNDSIEVLYEREDVSTVRINGSITSYQYIYLNPGESKDVIVEVTAPDGVTKKTYIIHATRPLSSVIDRASFYSPDGLISDSITTDPYEHYLTIPSNKSSTTINADTGYYRTATIQIDGANVSSKTISLAPGTTKDVYVEFTAFDGVTKQLHIVHVTRPGPSDPTLRSLYINKGILSPAFASNTEEYMLLLPANETADILPFKKDSAATMLINGTARSEYYSSKQEDVAIAITSQDGTAQKTYTIHVKKQYSNNANLSSLGISYNSSSINNLLMPAFTPDISEYSLTLPYSAPMIYVRPYSDNNAKVEIEGATGTELSMFIDPGATRDVKIKVTAQDQTTTKTYTIHITKLGSNTSVLDAGLFYPKDIVYSPSAPLVYMTGTGDYNSGKNIVYEMNYDTGAIRQLTMPYYANRLALVDSKLYVTMTRPEKSLDTVAIINLGTFTIQNSYDFGMDIIGIRADSNWTYIYSSSEIDVYSKSLTQKISSISCSGLQTLEVNSQSGRLYGGAQDSINEYQVVNGQIGTVRLHTSYGATRIWISPDGTYMVTGFGEVFSCSTDPSKDMILLGDINYVPQWVEFDNVRNEFFTTIGKVINVYDASSLSLKHVLQEPVSIINMFETGGKMMLVSATITNRTLISSAYPGAALESIKLNGDTISGFYPLVRQYDLSNYPYDAPSIEISAEAMYPGSTVSGDTGHQTLSVGKNTFHITVKDQYDNIQTYDLTIYRKSDSLPHNNNDARILLGFTPIDYAKDPDRPVIYITADKGYKLYAVNYMTGEIKEKTFDLPAEHLSAKNGKVYLNLLRQSHSAYNSSSCGALAVIDTANWQTERIFDVETDPYDTAVDDTGKVYITPGSDQGYNICIYDTATGQKIPISSSAYNSLYYGAYIEYNPQMHKIYAVSDHLYPRNMTAFEIRDNTIKNSYGSDTYGDSMMSTYIKVSPDGEFIFNGAGTVYKCSEIQSGDMTYICNIDKPYSSICFNTADKEFYTAGNKELNVYSYDTFELLYTIPLKNEIIWMDYSEGQIIVIEKTDVGGYRVNTINKVILLDKLNIDGRPMDHFLPLESEQNLIETYNSSVNISCVPNDDSAIISGDTGDISLVPGDNILNINVKNPGGSIKKNYKIHIVRKDPANAQLSNLVTSAGSLSPLFDAGMYEYNLALDCSTGSVKITPQKDDVLAKLLIDGVLATDKTIPVDPGSTTDIHIEVTAYDNATMNNYVIHVKRPYSNNSKLKELRTTAGSLTHAFDPEITEYTLNTPGTVMIAPIKADNSAVMKIDGILTTCKAVTFSNGASQDVSIEMTAQDKVTTSHYTVHVVKKASSNADLTGINLTSGLTLSPSFSNNIHSYNVTLPGSTYSIYITPMKYDPTATVKIDGAVADYKMVSINAGTQKDVGIEVIAEDGVTKQNFTIHVSRLPSSEAGLSSIFFSGMYNLSVSKDINEYPVALPSSTSSTTVMPYCVDSMASIKIDGAAVTSKKVELAPGARADMTILVTAQDGSTTKTYTLHFYRDISHNADLSYISTSLGQLSPAFNSATLNYSLTIPANNTSVTVTPYKSDSGAQMKIDNETKTSKTVNLNPGMSMDITIEVTASDNTTVKQYTIHIARETSHNADLSGLGISGDTNYTLSPVFNAATTEYNLTLSPLMSAVSFYPQKDITATMEINGSAVSGKQFLLDPGEKKDVSILVTAQDGSTGKTYTIHIERLVSHNANLKDITVSTGTLSPAFSKDIYTYDLNLPGSANGQVSITPEPEDPTTELPDGCAFGLNLAYINYYTLTINTVAQDKTNKNTYTIHVIRPEWRNAELSAVNLSPGVTAPAIKADVNEYTVTVPASVGNIMIQPILFNRAATVRINSSDLTKIDLSLAQGEKKDVIVDITAEDKLTKKEYIFHVERQISFDACLSRIQVSTGSLSPVFKQDQYTYSLTLDENTPSATITPIKYNPSSRMMIDGRYISYKSVTLDNDHSASVKVTVIPQSGERKYYTINIYRQRSTNKNLASISTNSKTAVLSPAFLKDEQKYTIILPETQSSVKISAIKDSKYATVSIDGRTASSKTASVGYASTCPITISVMAQDGGVKNYYIDIKRPARISTFSATPSYRRIPTLSPGGTNSLAFSYFINGSAETRIDVSTDGVWKNIFARSDSTGGKTFVWDGKVDGSYLTTGSYSIRIYSAVGDLLSQPKYLTVSITDPPKVSVILSLASIRKGQRTSAKVYWDVTTNITIVVVDQNDNIVTTLYSGLNRTPSWKTLYWYGKNAAGAYVPPGIYKIRVYGGNNVQDSMPITILP